MNCKEYFEKLKSDYNIAKVLSRRNESMVILLKHKNFDKYIVYREYRRIIAVYDYLQTIHFENFPIVYDTIRCDDGEIILEEYIDAISVSDVLQNGLYTYKGAKKVICAVCNALNLLHENGYVHRDVKPENVLISKNGVVKLIDYNVSRKYSPNKNEDTVELGTIGYAAPEQLGLAQTDFRTDIYSVGVLLNVMLTGVHPSIKLANGRAKKIVLKCTQISPESRFQSIIDITYML